MSHSTDPAPPPAEKADPYATESHQIFAEVLLHLLTEAVEYEEYQGFALPDICRWEIQSADVWHHEPVISGQLSSPDLTVRNRSGVAEWANAFHGEVAEDPRPHSHGVEAQFRVAGVLFIVWGSKREQAAEVSE